MSDEVPPIDPSRTILVEFGELTDEQKMLLDLHSQRALAAELPAHVAGRYVIEFWIRDGETRDDVYDDIKGWAISNRLPIGRLLAE